MAHFVTMAVLTPHSTVGLYYLVVLLRIEKNVQYMKLQKLKRNKKPNCGGKLHFNICLHNL